MNELIVMQIGASGPLGKGVKRSTLGSGGQRSRSREAEYRVGGQAEASFGSSSFCSLHLRQDSS